jgi:O-acetyl-ADP-ribose deacetylase (regulator of RNase III)
MARIRVEEGDITAVSVDAIVNAANTRLQLGTGVAGAISSAGGPTIQEECDAHGPIALGDAAITGAGELPARHVIHAASMEPGQPVQEENLRSSCARCLELAEEHGLRSIAFPAIGTGVGGLSLQRSAEIMLEEVRRHVERGTGLEEIHFVLFGEPAYRVFEQVQDADRIRVQMEKLRR